MTDTAILELHLGFELPSAPDEAARLAMREQTLALLHAHGLDPAWSSIDGGTDSYSVHARWTHTVDDMIDRLVRFAIAQRDALPAGSKISGIPTLRPRNVLHRSPPPIRASRLGSILSMFDPTARMWNGTPPEGYDAPLSLPAWRQLDGTTQILRWARDPLTPEEIQRAVLAQEGWYLANVTEYRPYDDGEWNALGDRYEPSEDIEFDPDRIHATRDAAVAAGPGALYRDDDDNMWDPHPEGYIHVSEPHVGGVIEIELATAPSPDDGLALLHQIIAMASARAWYVEDDTRPGEQLTLDELRWPQRRILLRGDSASLELSGRDRVITVRVRRPLDSARAELEALFDAVERIPGVTDVLEREIVEVVA